MKQLWLIWAVLCLWLAVVPVRADVARGRSGMVASVNATATRAGVAAMKNGGNAIDAAVAVALTLGVVDGYNSGIGGGCFMLIRRANGEIIALDGREMAPARATRTMFVRGGKGDTSLSQTGALASGVPGSVAVYESAVERYGRHTFADALLPAADIAERGFAVDADYARRTSGVADRLRQFPASRAIFLRPDGAPLQAGDILRQSDLARSYRALAKAGSAWFYRGEFARATGNWMAQNGGLIGAADFANYRMLQRAPLRSRYRGAEIVGFAPPSSGGIHVAQILNILEPFDLKNLPAPERVHVVAEAMKRAFADRAFYGGDPAFAPVPRGLTDAAYGRELAGQIDILRATSVKGQGNPYPFDSRVFGKHTTHFSTADSEGNWVACTATVNTTFGSKVVIPGTGVVMNDQMDDFSIDPGVPNAFGLIGGEANAIAPGKRPLSSMSPTIVLRDGQPILSLGAAGGPTIISQTVLNLVGILDLGWPLDEALAQPRYHQQWVPDELRIEKRMPAEIKAALRAKGHKLDEVDSIGASNIVGREGDELLGASEPRIEGLALGF